ncbi:hypothetical protein [Lachnoclostridium sp. Marseille-P6806]|uniref:hypothetical protein n=1 Tax=Lachnoclostridium sp. Marseille-P6806 TaxID=2364793 RepID=UPI001F5F7846|nr:hypothetical protein [Lachnoclostridium sp. Marseille-P6806]
MARSKTEAPAPEMQTEEMPAEETKAKKTVTVRLPKAIDGESKYQFVAINGRTYQIEKNKNVEVPPEVAEVLRNSLEAQEEADEFNEANAAND